MKGEHAWLYLLSALVLLGVFLAYLQPEFALTAVNWISRCF